jgi:ABC-type polysaccharide/polyol phosphate transport system ATPase subunit
VATLRGVSKRFLLSHRRAPSLKERLLSRSSRSDRERRELWALRDVSLSIARGETLAIIGANGSGKSTLLQLLAGIYEPDEGTLEVAGRVTSLLELGAGFVADLSGRENIFLNASLYGVSRADVQARFDSIVAFAELERFIDTPVRNYSSGMYMRLGFAVAVHLEPGLLLIDEAFAVGDEAFQRKCLRRIHEFQQQDVTIVVVSHDLRLSEMLATRACLLHRGRLEAEGRPADVIARYHGLAAADLGASDARRWGSREIAIEDVELLDRHGAPLSVVRTREPLTIRVKYHAGAPVSDPVFGLAIHREDGLHVTGPNTRLSGEAMGEVSGDGAIDYRIAKLPLLPGRYEISASAYHRDLVTPFDHRDRFKSFTVLEGGTPERYGLIELDAHWTREGAAGGR